MGGKCSGTLDIIKRRIEPRMPTKKARVGDIAEIRTPAGLGYVQYTHDGRDMGELVRVLPGLHATRPLDFINLGKAKELYFVFYPLNYSLRARNTDIVSHQPVPEWARPYPSMRWHGARDKTGKTLGWKIISASSPMTLDELRGSPTLSELTPQQQKLSIHQLWPHPIMVKELARGWTPERDEELRLADISTARTQKASQPRVVQLPDKTMRHYLYFPQKPDAEVAGQRLREWGFSVDVLKGADGENWLALARRITPTTAEEMEELRNELEVLAAEFNGIYDGWEFAVKAE